MNRATTGLGLGELLVVLFSVVVIAARTVFDLSAFSTQASSSTTTTTISTTSTTTVASPIRLSCSVLANCVSVELLGCSVSTKVCSLVVQSGYTSGSITISQDPGCIDLEWFPAPGVQSGTTSSSCTITPSPTLAFGQRASVNATVDFYYIPQTNYGPPPVGSEVSGTLFLSVMNASATTGSKLSFSGEATP